MCRFLALTCLMTVIDTWTQQNFEMSLVSIRWSYHWFCRSGIWTCAPDTNDSSDQVCCWGHARWRMNLSYIYRPKITETQGWVLFNWVRLPKTPLQSHLFRVTQWVFSSTAADDETAFHTVVEKNCATECFSQSQIACINPSMFSSGQTETSTHHLGSCDTQIFQLLVKGTDPYHVLLGFSPRRHRRTADQNSGLRDYWERSNYTAPNKRWTQQIKTKAALFNTESRLSVL